LLGRASAQTLQPGEAYHVITDYVLPPATLELGWKEVLVVARVRIKSSAERDKQLSRGPAVPVTEHRVLVLEVLKGSGLQAGQVLTVSQDTIDSASPSHGQHQSGGELLRLEGEYVLFLDAPTMGGPLQIAWGSAGVFNVDSADVRVPALARRMWHFREDVPLAEFLDTLRRLKATDPTK
jgi:hypothetical protein